ncbi:DUF3048 domain-containing protein [Patescibacteria group bacterium]|nr:DUF3048 domain-containing protein [Patescibacteria group bacterium]
MKRSWPQIAGGAVLILLLCGTSSYLSIRGTFRKADDGIMPPLPTEATSSTDMALRRLDGLLVADGEAVLQPYAVMVENAPEARPLMGPARANLVVEAPVEGGITRLMLVFDATSTAEQIGPVRSARPYFVEFAVALGAVYAHCGGSPDGLARIRKTEGFRDLDEFSNGIRFWRSSKRSAPHNIYTSMERLRAGSAAKEWSEGSVVAPWRYLNPDDGVAPGDITDVRVPYGGTFTVVWSYDVETGAYTRSQAGSVQRDADGTVVTSTNVIILLTEERVLDSVGRLKIRTTGSGKAWLFRDGQRFDVTWHRPEGGWLRFETTDGNDVLFRPGKTWISIITESSMAPASSVE